MKNPTESHAYKTFSDFLNNKMRMSHIYQPVMLRTLLANGGRALVSQIAKAFLERDESQVEYYEYITKQMPGRVLGKHGLVERKASYYELPDSLNELSPEERDALIRECDQKVTEYVDRRGSRIWKHRSQAEGHIPGKDRYQTLKRAGYHCELCGVSAHDQALHIDHILPRKHGGTDDPENFQALCWRCNADKGAGDDTDFRTVRESYQDREEGCPFCDIDQERVFLENTLAVAVWDGFPVTPSHALLIPKRHTPEFSALYESERKAIFRLVEEAKALIQGMDGAVEAFNFGVNEGEAAGQTIDHAHVHLIPRRSGDIEDPRGGVRGVIPEKRIY